MAKKDDLAKQIAALQKEMESAEAEGDDYEIHIQSGDKSAKLPASKAKGWLHDNFGIGEAPEKEGDDEEDGDDEEGQEDPPAKQSVWGRK